jgi:L-ascorbate metabolism protein UlaG (beta-lactamase superfamily)
MDRRNFMNLMASLSGAFLTPLNFFSRKTKIRLHFIRHATFVLEWDGVKILVDPMLSDQGAMDPVKITRNTSRIPMKPLPFSSEELTAVLKEVDGVLITHTHRDHWDEAARALLPKDKLLICQPADVDTLSNQKFSNLMPVHSSIALNGLQITRTSGQHGTGEIGKRMGTVSGFMLRKKDKTLYIAGDTIWCEEVDLALKNFKPNFTILNAGAARFDEGDPITMTAEDVKKVCESLPTTQVITIHMDTVNHCDLTREKLSEYLQLNQLEKRCQIPMDGEQVEL